MFVHGEVCLASRTVSPFTLTGSCRDLTASAADIEPTLDRWREMPDTGSSLEFHSLLSVEFDPDCLARKQRGMFVLRRPQMMKMLRFFCFRIMLKFYKLASCNLSSGSVLKSSQNYVLLLSPLGRLNDHSFTLPKFSISREQINCNILKFSSRSSPFFQVVIVLFA